jgi:hypothetical protein
MTCRIAPRPGTTNLIWSRTPTSLTCAYVFSLSYRMMGIGRTTSCIVGLHVLELVFELFRGSRPSKICHSSQQEQSLALAKARQIAECDLARQQKDPFRQP